MVFAGHGFGNYADHHRRPCLCLPEKHPIGMTIWLRIVAGVLDLFRSLAAFIQKEQAKQDGRNEVELAARREADRASDVARDAVDRVSDDLDEIRNDPNNRRRKGRPVP
jgi:hypothetical protein